MNLQHIIKLLFSLCIFLVTVKMQFDIVNLEANLWPVVLLVDRAVKAEEMRFTNERNKKVGDMTVASLIVRAKESYFSNLQGGED